jgi:predicted NAD-dependent protein-ADP-ribosyltransferase YbiA (DUF1768 family)
MFKTFFVTSSLFLMMSLSVQAKANTKAGPYPAEWWRAVARDAAPAWEVLPQDAGPGQVVLSKRTELGQFSNLASTPFVYDQQNFGSIEGLWQMMKYPDPSDATDPRLAISDYPFTRDEVKLMAMWDAKSAGDAANKIMKDNGINWISYQGKRFNYKDMDSGSAYHYEIIYRAIWEKVQQHPGLKQLLLQTKGLELLPDHKQSNDSPPSYFYHRILMDIREKI